MSEISLTTIITEAGETSGALKQADYALKQGRDVLIPQLVLNNTSLSWPKKYIKKGTHSFNNLKEVLEILNKTKVFYKLLNNDEINAIRSIEI